MNKRKGIAAAVLGTMALSLAWPMPSNAEGEEEEPKSSPFAGYSAYAQAGVVRVQIFEESLPIPTSPQLDFNILYSRSDGSTGPSNRSNANVLWPGDTLGDGLGTLAGNEAVDWPIKVKSKFPETTDSPRENSIEVYKGSGMRTSADESGAAATTSALDYGGGKASGPVKGLCGLLMLTCPVDPTAGITLPSIFTTAVKLEGVKSSSSVKVGDVVKSVADTKAAGVSIMGGLITIDGVHSHSEVTSDGTKATPSGFVKIGAINIAGQKFELGNRVDVAGQGADIPKMPNPLAKYGLGIEYFLGSDKKDKASGTYEAQGLKITLDAKAFSKSLSLGGVADPLTPLLEQIPTLGTVLIGVLQLGSKVVITVGDVSAMAAASPTYVPPPVDPGPGDPTDPAAPGGESTPPGGGDDLTGAGPDVPGLETPVETPPGVTPEATPPAETGNAPASFALPGLGQVPTLLILAALALAGLYGWLFKTLGGFIVGGGTCLFGLNTGVPDLRKG